MTVESSVRGAETSKVDPSPPRARGGAGLYPIWRGDTVSLCRNIEGLKSSDERLCPKAISQFARKLRSSWQHEVTIEKMISGDRTHAVSYKAGARAGPLVDCGSIPGHDNLVDAMAKPEHSECE